ncbi:hypothetical protein JG687_00017479, partial [Phytophthora cactorum]
MLAPKRNVRAIVAFAKRWKPLVGRTTTPSSRGGKRSSGLQWRRVAEKINAVVRVQGGPDEQNYKGPGRKKQDHIWTRLGHLHEERTLRGREFVYWRHDRVHEDGAGSLARDVFS